MRIAAIAIALSALVAATPVVTPAGAQGLVTGQLEVKAYEKIPKTKTGVQLNTDTHLSRELRRMVMERLARRGNEVGFSGANVMRMDVSYIDVSLGIGSGQGGTIGGQPYDQPGGNPRMELPRNRIERLNTPTTSSGSTLRIILTLYTVDTGKVIWAATTSCNVAASAAERVGETMINAIFEKADVSRITDAGFPL